MKIEFRLSTNTITQEPIVEIWRNGEFIGSIYGHSDGLRIFSEYYDGVIHEPTSTPSVFVKLRES